jgi:hypothetical protein
MIIGIPKDKLKGKVMSEIIALRSKQRYTIKENDIANKICKAISKTVVKHGISSRE